MSSASTVLTELTVLFGLVWLGFAIDNHPIGRRTSGVVWILLAAMLLSNTGIIPFESATYNVIGGILVPISIPLLLLKADLRQIFRESGRVMLSFLLASVGTLLGAAVGLLFFDLGESAAGLAGTYAGSWIGGAVNFVAVSNAVGLNPQQVSEALGAGAGVSIIALLALTVLPSLRIIVRFFPPADTATRDQDPLPSSPPTRSVPMRPTHLAAAITISLAICAASWKTTEYFEWEKFNILLITVLAIAVANVAARPLAKIQGNFELGMLVMYLFFAAIGAGTNATAFVESASVLFFYGLTIIAVHLMFVFLAGKLLRLDMREVVIGSAAALVGPAPSAAIAAARGWQPLVTPGIMCGIFGYVIGTFLGVGLAGALGG